MLHPHSFLPFIGRLLLLAVFLGGLYLSGTAITDTVKSYLSGWSAETNISVLLGLSLLYVILLSIPFVPGVELGWGLLAILGVQGLIVVYPATVLGLCLSFLVGRWIPLQTLERLLHWLHWYRIEHLLASMRPLDRQNRLSILLASAPRKLLPLLLRHRFLALAVIFNMPGNSIVGGGGGIALLAGMSGLFSFPAFLLLVCIAITPIPLTLLFMAWR